MRKLLGRLGEWLVRKYSEKNLGEIVLEFYRLNKKPFDYEKLERKQQEEFLVSAHELWNNHAFHILIGDLTHSFGDDIIGRTERLDHMLTGRASIHTLKVCKDTSESWELEFQELLKKDSPEDFDPQATV